MEKPYTFDPTNPRLVVNVQRPSNLYAAAGAIFLTSLYVYNRRIYRLD
jgi:hypothetical protein